MKIRRSIAIGTFAVALSVLAIPAPAAGAETGRWGHPVHGGRAPQDRERDRLGPYGRLRRVAGVQHQLHLGGADAGQRPAGVRGGDPVPREPIPASPRRVRGGHPAVGGKGGIVPASERPGEPLAAERGFRPRPDQGSWNQGGPGGRPGSIHALHGSRNHEVPRSRGGRRRDLRERSSPTPVKAGEEASIGEEIRVSRVDSAAPGIGPGGGGAVDRGGGIGGDPFRRGRRAAALRRVGVDSGVRVRLASVRGRRLGAVLLRAVVLGLAVRMDLGRL